MHLIKIKDIHLTEKGRTTYLCAENISSIASDENTTIIHMKSGGTFEIEGDFSHRIAKLIANATSGNMIMLE